MQLYNNTFDSFSSANYIIEKLNKAINTTYIPSGDNIQEVINNFTKIQLGRSFNLSGFGKADLEMTFNEYYLRINYESTSCTSVRVRYNFDKNMDIKEIDISVWLPDDRAESGRCHYETLTQSLYGYDFLKVDWENKTAEIELPYKLFKLNNKEDWDLSLSCNIPNWVYEQQSNFIAHWNPSGIANELAALGYTPVENPIGYKAAYHNPNHYIQYVVVYEKLHKVDNNYYLLHNANDTINFNGGLSYKRLLELIKSTKDKQPRESRRSRRNCTTLIEQVEDYDYDESEYVDED